MILKFESLNDVVFVKRQSVSTSELGSGSFGKVQLVCHRNNPQLKLAMKMIKLPQKMERVFQEIFLHKNLIHNNII
jgi:hypothetical protein